MDLLFSRYASPFEFMRLYIDTGRFGEFVYDTVSAENKRREEAAEKDDNDKLWMAYIHSNTDKPFSDWKSAVLKRGSKSATGKKDEDLTKKDVDALLNRLFHKESPEIEL